MTEKTIVVSYQSAHLAPLERMRPPSYLDGSSGFNRATGAPAMISAENDYEAIQSYLHKFRDQEKTHRAYQKELERFLLWCLHERGKAMSSLVVDDCEAYKDFLANIPPHWQGTRKSRGSPDWRPFAGQISVESQRYAIQTIRAFFALLVEVRYLAANPWKIVSDPRCEKPLKEMQINKALPEVLWEKISRQGGILDQISALSDEEIVSRYEIRGFGRNQSLGAQARLVRAIVLLLGNTGMRREEVANASRQHLSPLPDQPGMWRLAVCGKRSKWRYVYPSDREVDAIKAHWKDRQEGFFPESDLPLVSPVIIPQTTHATMKHGEPGEKTRAKGFSPDGVYTAVTRWLKRVAADETVDLTPDERDILDRSGVHAFRHTFGSLAVADDVPLDVVQNILGHASLNTTTIYVRTEEARAAAEIGKRLLKR